jgi:hypothetical protein
MIAGNLALQPEVAMAWPDVALPAQTSVAAEEMSHPRLGASTRSEDYY